MKKLIIALILVLMICPLVKAEITALPATISEITLYDLQEHNLKVGLRYPALNWEEVIFLDGGLITDFNSTSIVGGLSVELCALGNLLGLNVTLPKIINFGFCGGYNFQDKCAVYGPYSGIVIKLPF